METRSDRHVRFAWLLQPIAALGVICLHGCGEVTAGAASESGTATTAVCVLRPVADSGVHGTIAFRSEGGRVHLTGTVSGLSPGEHGFHVHSYGDVHNLTDGSSAGGHFAPGHHEHGKPDAQERHVGDLGNIQANRDGVARIDIRDDVIALRGEHSVVGRALVVHAGEDEFTQPSGGAGARVAIGVIGLAAN